MPFIVLPPQNLTDMLKGWMFEAIMAGVVIVMLGQMLDQPHELKNTEPEVPALEIPRA